MFTKHVDGTLRQKMMIKIGLERRGGRAESAPQLVRGKANKKENDVHMDCMDSLVVIGGLEAEPNYNFIDEYVNINKHRDGSLPSGDMLRHAPWDAPVGVKSKSQISTLSSTT